MSNDVYSDKTEIQRDITEMVRQFADEQIIPNAEKYDHEDSFPEPIVEQMKELGLFGVTIPEEYGGMGLDLTTYAMIVEELSRGWISISGVVNTHFIGSYLLMKFGTEEQKQYFLPKMATGEIRAAFSLSEPEVGSDVQGIKSSAKKTDDGKWELNGQKMWVTNGLGSGVVFVLMKTDPQADPPHRGMTCFITEKEPWVEENTGEYAGLVVPPKIKKMGYKGVESTELVYDGYRCPPERILGGEEAARILGESGIGLPAYNGLEDTWLGSMDGFDAQVFVDAAEYGVIPQDPEVGPAWQSTLGEEVNKGFAGETPIEELPQTVEDAVNAALQDS